MFVSDKAVGKEDKKLPNRVGLDKTNDLPTTFYIAGRSSESLPATLKQQCVLHMAQWLDKCQLSQLLNKPKSHLPPYYT